eukprot:274959_1
MTEKEADPCEILDTLCQKHSNLSKYATQSKNAAKAVLQNEQITDRYKDEIEYITQQIMSEDDAKQDEEKQEKKQRNIIFHVTGFGQFCGVKDNPSTHLINNLSKYIRDNKNIPSNVTIATMKVLHVSGVNSLKELQKIRASNDKKAKDTIYVYLHFGVASSRNNLCLETVAYNCANFKGSPDELGWEPNNEMILKENKNIYHEYCTTLPVEQLQVLLAKQYGYDVEKSTDPGRYVCNWIFYNSLYFSLDNKDEYNMFIHVPEFDKVNQDTQCKFARDLIIETAKLLNWKYQ